MLSSLISSIAFFLIAVSAHGGGGEYVHYGGGIPVYACNLQINREVSFCPKPFNYSCLCTNENALATYAGCLAYKNRISEAALHQMGEFCENGNVELEHDWIDSALERFNKYAKSAREIEGFNRSIPINVPFILNETSMNRFNDAYSIFLGNYDDSLFYGTSTLMYWLLIIVIGAITNWTKFLFPGFTKKLTNPVINFWRKHVSMPAAFGRKKSEEQGFWKIFDWLLPSRFESIVIFLFYVFVVVIHCINITAIDQDPVFLTKYDAELRYVSDRTGIVATIMMPLTILFAGRNNFLQWISGYNYTAFMAYHRHTARIMFVLVVIHAVGFSILLGERYAADMKEEYLIWGTVATVAGGIILVQAMLFFRRRWYEIFLLIHIAMAVLWVVGTWIHVEELGYIWFVYPSVAVWALDRAVRIGRLVAFGFPTSDVILLADETIKVVVPKPSYWKSIPGGHAFIHFLKPTYFWQSHPFTFTESVEEKNNIVLYVKVKGGITHSLYQLLTKAPGKAIKMKVAIEGPYGEPTAARTADTAVFVAGGNGIPGIYSEVLDIALRAGQNSNKVLKLVWVVREYRSLFWFYEQLVSLKNVNIETTIYVTKPNNLVCVEEFRSRFASSDISSEDTSEKNSSREKLDTCDDQEKERILELVKSELSHIQFKEGRPNIEELVRDEVNHSAGSIGFVTCGHPIMVDELRYYCAQNISNPNKNRVDFYEQLQVWA
ncbi:uncharacterized protein J8A68_002511 [[Candida] subhashii]|uniref:FAD-binding FR-type domain-containing protein n=1 Tax=[Candida] subhashii TaxID=561895 RepID=A0A8J5UXY2_9ASCO|nr:uncharacterized protein J8A68_002511 [[Candida] subhashii]KAG7663950.1 hypothetical protein J8A68_002511 [[Candida] subhashii]